MELFAIISLAIIIIIIQHLLNWASRKLINEEHLLVLLMFTYVLGAVLTIICFKYIIIWGQPLLNN